MKKIVAVAVLLGVVTALGLGATLALAQGPATGQTPVPGYGPGWMRGGFGLGLNVDWRTQMQTAVAKSLGMSLDDLNAQLRAGKSIAQIAQSKNISLTKLHDDVQAAHKALIQQAVKDGKLTQTQADAMLSRLDAMDQYFTANGGAGFGAGMMGAGFRGGMGGRGFWTAPTTK